MRTSWNTKAAEAAKYVRVMRPTGWAGAYKRKPPKGDHRFMTKTDMAELIKRLEG